MAPIIPVLGSIVMGLCSVALFWATVRLGRDDLKASKAERSQTFRSPI